MQGFTAAADESQMPELLRRVDEPGAFGAELAALAETRALWTAAVGRYLTVAEAAKLLRVSSRQAVHQRLARRILMGMVLAGQTALPAYQFDGAAVALRWSRS